MSAYLQSQTGYEDSNEERKKFWLRNLDQVESYVRLEVVRRLEQENLQLPHQLQHQVHRQMIDIVKSAQTDAFRSYRQQDTQSMQTHRLDTNCHPSDSDSSQQSQTATDGRDLEATLAAPAVPEMIENAHDRFSMSTTAANLEPIPQASGLLCSFESFADGYGRMGRQAEDASLVDSPSLDVSFVNYHYEDGTSFQEQNLE